MTTIPVEPVDQIKSGLKILILDAGGAQAVSQLHILDHVMKRISQDDQSSSQGVVKRPCEVFDVIGGAGSGGLIAIFLVVLKMTAKEALEEFITFAIEVYKDADRDPKKQTERLQRAIHGILGKHEIDEDMNLILENEPTPSCRLIVPIMYNNNVGVTCVLRNHAIRQEPPTNLTIAEGMLATSATTPLFTPITIGKDFSTFEYISGDLGLSNPTREIIAGVHQTFGDEATVACLLSIGTGHSCIKSVPSTSDAIDRIDFLERVAMDSEKAAQEIAMQLSQLTIYHRFSVNYGLETLQSRVWREPEAIAAHTTVYLNDLEMVKVIDRCVDAIKTGHGSATLEQLRHSGGTHNLPIPLPPLTPNYVERKAPMSFVEKALFEQDGQIKSGSKRVVVTGIGGCGKTQLVRKFVEIHGDSFVSAFVVDGSSKDTLRRDLVRHVRTLKISHSQDSFEESMTFLSQSIPNGQRLLIIDNVDDPKIDLAPFLPRWTNGAVIVTSRNAERGQLSPSAHLQLDVMSVEESVELLVRGSGREWPPSDPDREAAMAVAKELGCHPIALVQAIGYMSRTGYSADVYITRLRSYREILLKDPATNQLDMRYLTAFASFDASYDILSPNAQNALHLLSFFHQLKFPLNLVTLAAEGDFSTNYHHYIPHGEEFERGRRYLRETFCPSGRWSPPGLDQIVASLRNQSLITVVPARDVTLLEMHSLVHEWSRLRVPEEIFEQVQAGAIRLLCCGARQDSIQIMRYLVNHIQALSSAWHHMHANDAASFGFILRESGVYADAAKLEENVYEVLKTRLGINDLDTIKASANLAIAYGQSGRYNDAEALQVEVLRQYSDQLGMENPQTIQASTNLAATYWRLGRYADAEALQVEALRQLKQLFGPDNPKTIDASLNLAITHDRLGRYADAQMRYAEVLRQRKQLLGIDHPKTIDASARLAYSYNRSGRHADAEVQLVEALRQRKELLGINHPDTIQASSGLASVYYKLGRYADAEVLQVDVLKGRKQLLGTDHPETIRASAGLAATYQQLGRYTDAEVLYAKVLSQYTQQLGVEHPDTISASAGLAAAYQQLGRYTDAEVLYAKVLSKRTQQLGREHPNTISASASLAAIYGLLGRYVDAEVLQIEVLSQRTQQSGMDHPDTINASTDLAATYWRLGRYTDAEALQIEVLRRREELFGLDNPKTIDSSLNLAISHVELGRHADAEVRFAEVLRQRKRLLGINHPKTIDASMRLANSYTRSGRYVSAQVLLLEAVRQQKELLGINHPDTINASAGLARVYFELRRYGEAEMLQVEVLTERKRLLGTDHPETIRASENLATTYARVGRYADSKALLVEVVRLRKAILGLEHPDTLRAIKDLAFIENRANGASMIAF